MEGKSNGEVKQVFTVPASLQRDGVPQTIAMREPTPRDELHAMKLAAGEPGAAVFAAVKFAVAELDGKPVEQGGADVEQFWTAAGPKLRGLIVQAYTTMTSASAEEAAAFFGSAQTVV